MTAQIPDRLGYAGKRWLMHTEPLGEYLQGLAEKPSFVKTTTANWRGYVAEWTVVDNRLYLTGVQGQLHVEESAAGNQKHHRPSTRPVTVEDLFPGRQEPIFADWFSGELVLPSGEMIQYVHLGHASRYESYRVLTLEHGVVVTVRDMKEDRQPIEETAFDEEMLRNVLSGNPPSRQRRWWQFWK